MFIHIPTCVFILQLVFILCVCFISSSLTGGGDWQFGVVVKASVDDSETGFGLVAIFLARKDVLRHSRDPHRKSRKKYDLPGISGKI
jgi:hypothetical protein